MKVLNILKPYIYGFFLLSAALLLLTMSYQRRVISEGWAYSVFLLATGLFLTIVVLDTALLLYHHRRSGIFPRLRKKSIHYGIIAVVASFLLRNRLDLALTLSLWVVMTLVWIHTERKLLNQHIEEASEVSPKNAK